MTYQQCLTCTRRNIPPEQVSCPACGSVDLRGYDPAAPTGSVRGYEYDPADDGGEGEDLDREQRAEIAEQMREVDEKARRP